MSELFLNRAARKDFMISLGVWMALELVCFGILPFLGLVNPESKLQTWFYASFPLGICGALLIGFGSRLTIAANRFNKGFTRFFRSLLGDGISLLGMVAIAFPLLIASIEFFAKAFSEL